jgi:hypothetical protein
MWGGAAPATRREWMLRGGELQPGAQGGIGTAPPRAVDEARPWMVPVEPDTEPSAQQQRRHQEEETAAAAEAATEEEGEEEEEEGHEKLVAELVAEHAECEAERRVRDRWRCRGGWRPFPCPLGGVGAEAWRWLRGAGGQRRGAAAWPAAGRAGGAAGGAGGAGRGDRGRARRGECTPAGRRKRRWEKALGKGVGHVS